MFIKEFSIFLKRKWYLLVFMLLVCATYGSIRGAYKEHMRTIWITPEDVEIRNQIEEGIVDPCLRQLHKQVGKKQKRKQHIEDRIALLLSDVYHALQQQDDQQRKGDQSARIRDMQEQIVRVHDDAVVNKTVPIPESIPLQGPLDDMVIDVVPYFHTIAQGQVFLQHLNDDL